MDKEQFDLVFSGQLVPGCELIQVKKNIQALFRINEAKVDVLFSGKPITLKKGLSFEAANKYRVAMKKAGARVDVNESADSSAESKPTPSEPSVATPVSEPVRSQNKDTSATTEVKPIDSGADFSTDLGAQEVSAPEPRVEIQAPEFGLSEVGGDLLSDSEKAKVVAVDVDTSLLSVAEQEGNLVSEDELIRAEAVAVVVPNFDVAPVGSDVLAESEKRPFEAANIDVSKLSVAEVGGRLSEESEQPPKAPDVSHITLDTNER